MNLPVFQWLQRPLAWTLLLTVALSAWALWWPQSDSAQAVVQAAQRSQASWADAPSRGVVGAVSAAPLLVEATAALPAALPELDLAVSRRDPFAPYVPPPPPVAKTAKVVSPPVAVPPPQPVELTPPPPQAPPMSYRYLGRFDSPAGQRTVYVEGPNATAVPVSVGTRLDTGFLVLAIAEDHVELGYPAIEGYKVKIPVPPRTPTR